MGKIRTLSADIPADEAGVVLPHEHVFVNLMQDVGREGLLHDPDVAVAEIDAFAVAGGGTLVDLTVGRVSRGSVAGSQDVDITDWEANPVTGSRPVANVRALQSVSDRTGVNIVAGTGHYRQPYFDLDWFDRTPVDRIAEYLAADIEEGIPGTDLRAGVIGEIGSDRWYVSAAEERSFRAAARAHHATGATITTHSPRWAVMAEAHLALLHEEGVPPEKIIVGHVDMVSDSSHAMKMARRGVWVQFDCFAECVQSGVVREPKLEARVRSVVELVGAGHLDQVLLSHDVFMGSHLSRNGGSGYSFLFGPGREALLDAGLSEEEFRQITQINPQRALAF